MKLILILLMVSSVLFSCSKPSNNVPCDDTLCEAGQIIKKGYEK